MASDSFLQQVQRNSVALISLFVALTTLAYMTWRNEETEDNWNTRTAGFEMLVTLGELQRVVYLNHYDGDTEEGNPRKGWVHVLVVSDLGAILPDPLPEQTGMLLEVWRDNWAGMGKSQASVDAIDAAVDDTREVLLEVLQSLR
ncbi:MAG: hypothetical protein ABFS23_01655 [Pseudomonadota bacterium]